MDQRYSNTQRRLQGSLVQVPSLDTARGKFKLEWNSFFQLEKHKITMRSLVNRNEAETIKMLQQVLGRLKTCGLNQMKVLSLIGDPLICKQFPHLQQLKLNLHSCNRLTDKATETLSFQIGHFLPNLKHLSIGFSGYFNLTKDAIEAIGRNICHNLIQLESLILTINTSLEINNKDLQKLMSYICRYLKNLKEFKICLCRCGRINNAGLEMVVQEFAYRLPNLQSFSFDFLMCGVVQDKGLALMGSVIGRHLRNLKKLDLRFVIQREITDKGLEELASHIGQDLVSLKELHLNFINCSSISDKGLEGLGIALAGNKSGLQSLALKFAGCEKISDDGFEALLVQISNLIYLKHLKLYFNYSNIGDTGFIAAGRQITRNLLNLEVLLLDFSDCENITAYSVESIADMMSKQHFQLQRFKLALERCTMVSSEYLRETFDNTLSFIPKLEYS